MSTFLSGKTGSNWFFFINPLSANVEFTPGDVVTCSGCSASYRPQSLSLLVYLFFCWY